MLIDLKLRENYPHAERNCATLSVQGHQVKYALQSDQQVHENEMKCY